jgi:hypothetical protein
MERRLATFQTVKLFDLVDAPADILDAARTLGAAFIGDIGEHALWEICVGAREWEGIAPRNKAELRAESGERRLHLWLAENGARAGETVIVKVEAA